jgi:hypothetical protein
MSALTRITVAASAVKNVVTSIGQATNTIVTQARASLFTAAATIILDIAIALTPLAAGICTSVFTHNFLHHHITNVTSVIFFISGLAQKAWKYFSSPTPHAAAHERASDFRKCRRLQTLLHQIQQHLTHSFNAVVIYHTLLGLLGPGTFSSLSDDQVKSYLLSNWPTFVPRHSRLMDESGLVCWFWVDKTPNTPNQIELNPDLVDALETAPEVNY